MSDIVERLEKEITRLFSQLASRQHLEGRRIGRLEGLEDAAKYVDDAGSRNAELSRLTALVEHLKADRIRISEEAEAEIARLKEERDAAKAAGRLEGLEEAAKVADAHDLSIMSSTMEDAQARKIAAAIRALKEKET